MKEEMKGEDARRKGVRLRIRSVGLFDRQKMNNAADETLPDGSMYPVVYSYSAERKSL